MGEGIYTGITGNVKSLWAELPDRSGKALYTLGCFLKEVNKPYKQENFENCHQSATKMKELFDMQNHSGGSAMVVQQMLLAVFGANAVSDTERAYILEKKE